MDDLDLGKEIEKPLRPQSEVEVLSSVRDGLIVSDDTGHWIRICGHEMVLYTDWYDAIEALEEILKVRPFTFDV